MQIANRYRKLVSYLPYDAEVEWLQGDGASGLWIPCDVNNARFEVGYYIVQEYSQHIMQNAFRGSEASNVDINIYHYSNSSTLTWQAAVTQHMNNQNEGQGGSTNRWSTPNFNCQKLKRFITILDIPNNRTMYSLDNFTPKVYTPKSYNSLPFIGLLCRAKSNNDATNFSVAKISYCKIYVNDVLTYDFIPVRKNGVGYFYEKVTGELWGIGAKGGKGTGNFVIGPDNNLTARSYIQDGLVAIWDAKENIGWKKYSATSTVWTELISGRNSSVSLTNHEWAHYSLQQKVANARGVYLVDKAFLTAMPTWTFQTCQSNMSNNSNSCTMLDSPNDYSWVSTAQTKYFGLNSRVNFAMYTGSFETYNLCHNTTNGNVYCSTRKTYSSTYNLQNSYLPDSVYAGTYSDPRPVGARIHAVRIYNRVLTQAELNYNFEIDARRFNI